MKGSIKQIIEIIINEESTVKQIKESIDKLYQTFAEITKLDGKLEKAELGTILEEGEILSPRTSAGSILDYVGITKFLRGVKKAIDFQLKLNQGKIVKIIYVSSGPYASILFPLIPLFNKNEIEINVVDYHEISINALKSLITHFGFDNYFHELLAINPIKYSSDQLFDLIIIDNIQKGLVKEPQVAYTNHYSKFLSKNGTLIPEEIKISAFIANLQNEIVKPGNKWTSFWQNIKRNISIDRRIFLNDIFILDKEVQSKYNLATLTNHQINLTTTKVPNKLGQMANLVLRTEIKIFDDVLLIENDDTGITKPYFDRDVPPIEEQMEISFSYLLGNSPRFLMNITKP
jgi:hypothetical protein